MAHPSVGQRLTSALHGALHRHTAHLPPAVRGLLRRQLESQGYAVLEARDGNEAIEIFLGHRGEVGLVLLDLTMPGKDGGEVLRELRTHDAELPVIVMSGYSEQELVDDFTARGAAGFLQKPFNRAELVQALTTALAGDDA